MQSITIDKLELNIKTNNPKEERRRKKSEKYTKTNYKTIKLNPIMSMITTNINPLNTQTKSLRFSNEWKNKTQLLVYQQSTLNMKIWVR